MSESILRIVDFRSGVPSGREINHALPRAGFSIEDALANVAPIIESVANSGESALVEITEKFDGFDPRPIRVTSKELKTALDNLSPALRESLETAIERVRLVSLANLPESTTTELGQGAIVHQRWEPVEAVGLYVPGGKAVYPSSVVMNVVPAQVAGVQRLVIATPGQRNFGGRPHPTVLAAAALLGVDEVYNIGGPAAIAAMALGVSAIDLEPVAMITGPGNTYVTAAKRALRGVVGIDSEAGTTEILVVADSTANPDFVAADLLSQAEHDESAASVLVTNSLELAEAVQASLSKKVSKTLHAARARCALSGEQSAIVLVSNISDAILVANAYATEHLELQVSDPHSLLPQVRNAGAIFLGAYSPVSLGDYMAGSNHVLPTSGNAKFGAGLSVHTFLRAQQIVDYGKDGLEAIAERVERLAKEEGLPAHFEAISTRFDD